MPEEYDIIDKQIGLVAAIALTVGNAIAITMFVLPAHLIAEGAGPSVALATAATDVPTIFSIFLMLQLGGAMPAAGGMYVYISRLVSPFWGFAVTWVSVPAVWFGLVYVGYGFAEYVQFYLPMTVDAAVFSVTIPLLSLDILILSLLIPFLVLNLLGIRLVANIQLVLVAFILLGMLLFIVPGSVHVEGGNYSPMFPEGYLPFVTAIVSMFIGMDGFGLALNIGEEIKNPIKNIPRVIGISSAIGVTLMVAIVVVAVGVLNFEVWSGETAGGAFVASESGFLPSWAIVFVSMVAVFGAITTINTVYVSFSGLVMPAARDWVFPKSFATVSERFGCPQRAVLLIGGPALLLVPVAPGPVPLSIVLSLALLTAIIFLAVAAYRLPKLSPPALRALILQTAAASPPGIGRRRTGSATGVLDSRRPRTLAHRWGVARLDPARLSRLPPVDPVLRTPGRRPEAPHGNPGEPRTRARGRRGVTVPVAVRGYRTARPVSVLSLSTRE